MGWTPEEDLRLRALAAEKRSYGEVAQMMGKTKNAVVGRAHRLKLSKRPTPIVRRVVDKAKGPKPIVRQARVRVEAPVSRLPSEMGCRWIEGEPRGAATLFCDAPRRAGASWCEAHHARWWRQGLGQAA